MAVVGTLVGALIGVMGGLVNAQIQAASEDRRLASQFAEARRVEIRNERRTAYARFTTSTYHSFNASSRALIAADVRDAISRPQRVRVATEATKAYTDVEEAYAPLLFVASQDVERAATEYKESLRRVVLTASDALLQDGAVPSLSAATEESQRLAQLYLIAVRHDLGLQRD
jgi:hypothetical protein